MMKFDNKPYLLQFCELGDYGDIIIEFKTLKESKERQKELIERNDPNYGYFTQISKIIEVRRKEPHEKEQVKRHRK